MLAFDGDGFSATPFDRGDVLLVREMIGFGPCQALVEGTLCFLHEGQH